ncbi:MAG: C39 family peptidase [Moraxella sp.]|uniref:C39 family peptidase n=1 Tax=Moraxella sp. TaxID=479 RepID=UPI0026DD1B59|nr:C39 family peptidase [Moraxella sp.]MDO4450996.1 C39 family peptidase [Moraxella sp.]
MIILKFSKSSTNKPNWFVWGICIFAWLFVGVSYANWQYHTPTLSTKTTWKEARDNKLTKQDVDYSCGASSLSTILTYFYQNPKTEQQILDDMALDDVMASFLDLAKVSEKYGYTARGMTMNYEALAKIKIPAIVYVNHKRSDHFSVVRAIDEQNVYLADSSWGNRILTKKQFEKIWLTTNDNMSGKVLLILPTTNSQKQLSDKNFTAILDTQSLLKQSPTLFRRFL